ncbi:hypothetical protein TCAL_16578 [Tigriopus californicus]|uniref:Uncharacterized protein n=1 Tax=Tigriopus californicus TaxID=6832 RepID=A0A553NAU0_TIGCA|nr:hypothetical protein TCAL_16578 [Tigriopus californicus]
MGSACCKKKSPPEISSGPQPPRQPSPEPVKTNGVHDSQSSPLTRRETPTREILFSGITLSARNALRHLEVFGEEYVREKFESNFHVYHMSWIDQRYDWFLTHDEIPKNLNETLDQSWISACSPQESLPQMKQFLERIKLVLSQIAKDLTEVEDRYAELFAEGAHKIPSRNPLGPEFIPQGIMEVGHTSFRYHRDWFLYRDSRNILEYVIALSEYFKNHYSS